MTVSSFMSTCSRVLSCPYSSDPGGNRCWRYHVVDISVQVLGQPSFLNAVQESLEGASTVLTSLQFGPFHPDPCLMPAVSCSASPPAKCTSTSMSVSSTHSLFFPFCLSIQFAFFVYLPVFSFVCRQSCFPRHFNVPIHLYIHLDLCKLYY